jgi:hypothetical protein
MQIHRLAKIYDDGRHNAFTDVCWFQGRPYVTFRHAANHISHDGRVLVLRGDEEGRRWQTVACLWSGWDTRDPAFLVTPEGLFCWCFFSDRRENGGKASGYAFSADGEGWTAWQQVEENWWYWHPEWYQGRAYCAAYTYPERKVMLKQSEDGRQWFDLCLIPTPAGEEAPNEVAMAFRESGEMVILIRRDGGSGRPLLGRARPPYTQWELQELPVKLQGPMIWLKGETIYISGRWYQPSGMVNTAVFRVEDGQPIPQLVLPSGGDTSYMGVVAHPEGGGRFWLSYYSSHEYSGTPNSHEAGAAIYLCDVTLDP